MAREFELRKEVELPATPEEVWLAIATGPGVTAWFRPMEINPESPVVTTWKPPHKLTIRAPAAQDGSTHAFEYLVEGRDGGTTVLRFVHSGMLADDWSDEYEGATSGGWDMYLFTLSQYLRFFCGLPATYVEAQAAVSDRWDRLIRQLGFSGLGGKVIIDLPDGSHLSGEVDYLNENYVGLRAADGLIRFHERSAIGLPIAVSDHHYGAPVADLEGRAEFWKHWFADVLDPKGATSISRQATP